MLFLYVNGTDRTGDLQRETLEKQNQVQQRADTLNFTLFQGSKPSYDEDVKLYVGDTVKSIAGAVITLDGHFEKSTNKFYAGQIIHLRIGQTDETKATVLSYDESTLILTLTTSPSVAVNRGDKIGELVYGGVISRTKDQNIEVLANLEYPIECVDYTKIFDKKLIADSWIAYDGRQIINDFLNTTINYNSTVDSLSYGTNGAIQAVWTPTNDGNAATVDLADFIEGSGSGSLNWTFAGGTAKWEATPTIKNVSPWTGVNNGTPTKGFLMFWVKPLDYTKITALKLRIGSSNVNYVEVTLPLPTNNNWQYLSANLATGTVVGVPDWTVMNYAAIIITETATSSTKVNGFRLNSTGSFTAYNLNPTTKLDDFRSNNIKPTALMQTLAKNFSFMWYVDYEKDVHFFGMDTISAPFSLTDTSNNFKYLTLEVDQSQLSNRVIVQGGETDSVSQYAQVVPGDAARREWLMKNKFDDVGMTIKIDDNTTTHAAEVGTITTNIKITGHGLSSGDHVINRTRGNTVRQILVVDANNFTVEAVVGQTNGDTISFFAISKTYGREGLDDESVFDYMVNAQVQSVRASTQTITLSSGTFIRFSYFEKIPIQIQYTDTASANALKALGLGDGVFDLLPVSDVSIQDLATAVALAQAAIQDYKNPIVTATFKTDRQGLRAGQTIHIQDSVRGIGNDYLIQIVAAKQIAGEFSDYFIYEITAGTTLFGLIEFYQKLLARQAQVVNNINEVVETFVTASEGVTTTTTSESAAIGGFKKATKIEGVTAVKTAEHTYKHNQGTWHWEASVGQDLPTRWNLFDWG